MSDIYIGQDKDGMWLIVCHGCGYSIRVETGDEALEIRKAHEQYCTESEGDDETEKAVKEITGRDVDECVINPQTVKEVDELRKLMGTLPLQQPKFETKFWRGVEGIQVKLIDCPRNIYKAIYTLATSCWGNKIDKWDDTKPEHRFTVVKAVLERQTLPLATEAGKFVFAVDNISRWSFDQIARARIGVVFSSLGTRDNNHLDMGFRVHEEIWKNPELLARFKKVCLAAKDEYKYIVEQGQGSWQTARSVLPISCIHRFSFAADLAALQNMCAKRMMFCEGEDTVAFAWLLREEIAKVYPMIANYLRPACDFAGKCVYYKSYGLSKLFGCLFAPCQRHPVKYDYATFNKSCSSKETISKQLGIHIMEPNEWKKLESFDDLSDIDKQYFRSV